MILRQSHEIDVRKRRHQQCVFPFNLLPSRNECFVEQCIA
jgi:hypothetical protein